MKITNNNNNIASPLKPQMKSAAKTGNAEGFKGKIAKKYDELIIDTKSETSTPDAQFVGGLKSKIMTEITGESNKDKIAKLKEQVAAGEYKPDADEIVKKMLIGTEKF